MADTQAFLAGLATDEERSLAQAILDGAVDSEIITALGVEQAQVDKMRVMLAGVDGEAPAATQTDAPQTEPTVPEVPAADTGAANAPTEPQA